MPNPVTNPVTHPDRCLDPPYRLLLAAVRLSVEPGSAACRAAAVAAAKLAEAEPGQAVAILDLAIAVRGDAALDPALQAALDHFKRGQDRARQLAFTLEE